MWSDIIKRTANLCSFIIQFGYVIHVPPHTSMQFVRHEYRKVSYYVTRDDLSVFTKKHKVLCANKIGKRIFDTFTITII